MAKREAHNGTRLILNHGIGLAIDLYYPFWSLLTDRFDVIVHDLRSHGWNALSLLEHHCIPTFISDHDRVLKAVDSRYGVKPRVGCSILSRRWHRCCPPREGGGSLLSCCSIPPPRADGDPQRV